MIEIQNGCTKIGENVWETTVMEVGEDRRDQVKFSRYVFIAPNNSIPEIGDGIENGYLVKRIQPKVNPDWSKWKDKDLYGSP